jgi:hypothetical protein
MTSKKILYLISFVLAASACENTIPVDFGDTDPQLVLNAQLVSASGEQRIYVSETSRTLLRPVRDAEVTLEVDGKVLKAEALPDEDQLYYAGVYGVPCTVAPGNQIKVTAGRDQRVARAEAEVTRPAFISTVDTLRVMQQDFDSTEEMFQFNISFQDIAGTTYYQIGVEAVFLIHMVDAQGQTLDVTSRYELPVSGANDPILSGGTVSVSIFDLEPSYLVFTDELFRDQSCTVHLSMPVSSLYPFYYSWEESFSPKYAIITSQYIPWLETLTLEGYHYLSSLNNMENFGYEAQLFVEPTTLPCNVSGGLGFVYARSRTEGPAIQGREQYLDYTYYAGGNE